MEPGAELPGVVRVRPGGHGVEAAPGLDGGEAQVSLS